MREGQEEISLVIDHLVGAAHPEGAIERLPRLLSVFGSVFGLPLAMRVSTLPHSQPDRMASLRSPLRRARFRASSAAAAATSRSPARRAHSDR